MMQLAPSQNVALCLIICQLRAAAKHEMRVGGKRRLLSDLTGYTFYRWRRRKPGIYVFNYHRIGDPNKTSFDPNVFSCTPEVLDNHIDFYKKNFDLIDTDELITLLNDGRQLSDRYALITFDDGYKDNHDLALPVLTKQNVSAIFFVCSDYLQQTVIPWWDQIAWMIKSTNVNQITLSGGASLQLLGENRDDVIRRVLDDVKSDRKSIGEKLAALSSKLAIKPPTESANELLMGVQEVQALKNAGMDIGSHTASHRILSHLSEQEQEEELRTSKAYLEEILDSPVRTVSYPVGGLTEFTAATQSIAQKVGYSVAFSFVHDVFYAKPTDRYRAPRFAADHNCDVGYLRYLATC